MPGGKRGPLFPQQPVPDYVDWDRWIGPAPATPFNENKLIRDWHENISNFSLGMISCWGIHHLDIAQWGNAADATGPRSVEGTGEFPREGSCDAILRWKVRFEYDGAAPVIFASEGQGLEQGVRFVGDSAWVHVNRGSIRRSGRQAPPRSAEQVRHHAGQAADQPQPRPQFPGRGQERRPGDLRRRYGGPQRYAVPDRPDCREARPQAAGDPKREQFVADDAANRMLLARPIRGPWKLPAVL